ncbi:MAG: hypothetical protein ACE366_24740 [Bradymonadia bacterium]
MPTIEITLTADQSVRFDGTKIVITDLAVTKPPEMSFNIEAQPLLSRPSKHRKTRKHSLALATR